jgi:hypothetical protein
MWPWIFLQKRQENSWFFLLDNELGMIASAAAAPNAAEDIRIVDMRNEREVKIHLVNHMNIGCI